MIERDVAVEAEGAVLAGTLCSPAGPGRFPAVLMVHGTGPLDRDENMPGQRLDVFNTLARHLADHGVASLRYDKRGCGESTGDYSRAGYWDLVADATEAFDALRLRGAVVENQLFVVGHSEGCVIAPQISRSRPAVRGLVLLAPFLQDVETLLLRQARQIEDELRRTPGVGGRLYRASWRALGSPVVRQRNLIRRLKRSSADRIRVWSQPVPAKAMRELFDLDIATLFRQVTCPVLLIGGEKDVQCPPADAPRIAEIVGGPSEAHVIPDLTHILRSEPGPPSLLGTAALTRQPVEPVVLQLVTEWIRRSIAV